MRNQRRNPQRSRITNFAPNSLKNFGIDCSKVYRHSTLLLLHLRVKAPTIFFVRKAYTRLHSVGTTNVLDEWRIKDTGYETIAQSMLHPDHRHLSMFFSGRKESVGVCCASFLPFRRVTVAVIVSSLLRQRLGNNFAAQEEGKSQL